MAIPVTLALQTKLISYVTAQAPIQKGLALVFKSSLSLLGCETKGDGSKDAMRLLVFASLVHFLATYTVTAGLSISGQAMCGGYKNKGESILTL